MTTRRIWTWGALAISCACTSRHAPPTSAPNPLPTAAVPPPASNTDSTGEGAWSFTYAPGVRTYRITRNALARRADSASAQDESSSNLTHETLTFEVGPQGTTISAVVDSFAPVPAGLGNNVQPIQLPAQISGLLAGNAVTVTTGDMDTCSPIKSVLITDLQNLAVPFPNPLTPGLSWKDSLDLKGCQAGIPTVIHVTRLFLVRGEIAYQGRQVLEVARADSARMDGEGGIQQHHFSIHAMGSGTSTYYLNVNTGEVVHLSADQVLNIEVTTVSSKSHFRQDSKQEFVLTP
jgi:hypothetical protein